MQTPDEWGAVYIDGKRVEIAELRQLESGQRRMFAGGAQLLDVTPERIHMIRRKAARR